MHFTVCYVVGLVVYGVLVMFLGELAKLLWSGLIFKFSQTQLHSLHLSGISKIKTVSENPVS